MNTNEAPMSADEILIRLSHLARTATSASLQLRALGMLMRHYGMLSPRKSPNPPSAPRPDPQPAARAPMPASATLAAIALGDGVPVVQPVGLSGCAQRPHLYQHPMMR